VITAIGQRNDLIAASALQADGKIVVTGECANGNGDGVNFCLARYLPNGALDTSFNATGKVLTAIGQSRDYATAIALQPDSKIVVVGYCDNGSNFDVCIARYLPSGALDASFNSTGKVVAPIGSSDDSARALVLQSDGKIVVAGYCNNGSKFAFCLARFLPSGALDSSFNATGKVITSFGTGTDQAQALVLQADGKIIAAGSCPDGNNYAFCLARYLPSGELDSSFNGTGKVITTIGSGGDATAISLQPDNKVIVAGACRTGGNYDFCVARYLPNGSLDTSFNSTGTAVNPIGSSDDYARAIALQPDGKIVLAGYCFDSNNSYFCVARYLPSGALDSSFSTDGKVTSLIGLSQAAALSVALQPDGKVVAAGYCWNGTNDFCLARYEGGPNTPKTLTEYVYTPLNYYFLTSRDNEKAILDAAAGWSRTGQSFSSLTFADPASRGINRYYFDQIAKNQTRGSHFYTLVDSEKTALAALNPNNQASPRLPYFEGVDSYAYLPIIEGIGGGCAAGQVPVYRAFRGQTRFPDDPNHRFTTSLTLYNQLVAQGWDGEGVKLCAAN